MKGEFLGRWDMRRRVPGRRRGRGVTSEATGAGTSAWAVEVLHSARGACTAGEDELVGG